MLVWGFFSLCGCLWVVLGLSGWWFVLCCIVLCWAFFYVWTCVGVSLCRLLLWWWLFCWLFVVGVFRLLIYFGLVVFVLVFGVFWLGWSGFVCCLLSCCFFVCVGWWCLLGQCLSVCVVVNRFYLLLCWRLVGLCTCLVSLFTVLLWIWFGCLFYVVMVGFDVVIFVVCVCDGFGAVVWCCGGGYDG